MKKDYENIKQLSRRFSKEEIKKRLMDSLVYNENIDRESLNEQTNIVEIYEKAMDITKEYEAVIKTNKKDLILFKCQQDKVFWKFRENRKIKSLVEQIKITNCAIIFKMNIVELVDKYPKVMTSSVALNFLKSY